MKKSIYTFLILCLSLTIHGQVPKFQAGLATGNLLTFAHESENENMNVGHMLRYKAGLLFRSRLKENFQLPKPFPRAKKGVLTLDYGIGFLAYGHSYQYRGVELSGDQWGLEFPLLLTMYDRNDYWMGRKMRRKGFATFARMGIRTSYIFPGKTSKQNTSVDARLSESGDFGGFNMYWSVGGGLLQTNKAGHTFSVSISGNIGWYQRTNISVNYEDNSGNKEEALFSSNGNYLDIEAIYLFKTRTPKWAKGKLPPVIFNSRY